jgi:flagellar biosynthesis GTPase FlhF
MSEDQIDNEKGLTFEKVWAAIQKFGEKYDAILEREAQERKKADEERQKAEEKRQKAEEERQKAEEEERQKAEEKRQKVDEERQKADDERRKADDERIKQLEKKVAAASLSIGELGNRFGELAEHLVIPNIAKRFNKFGYHFVDVVRGRIEIFDGNQVVTEIDILLENEKTIAIVEVKAKPSLQDVRKHLKRMGLVRKHFDQICQINKMLIGAIAGAIFPDDVKKFTVETGFYVITQSGDTVKIEVPENFKPKIF